MRLFLRDRVAAILMLGVPLALVLSWVMWPALQSIYISTLRWNGTSQPQFVGADNFESLLDDPMFLVALENNIKWLVVFGVFSIMAFIGLHSLLR
jgi:multiple sugar transport system permease protein